MIFPTIGAEVGKYAGYNYVLVKDLPWGASEVSVFARATPAVANGDLLATPPLTSPNSFPVTMTSTGVPIVDATWSTVRQSLTVDVYDESLAAWYGATIQWINNALPVYDGSLSEVVTLRSGEAATPLSIAAAMTDADNDSLTYSIVSGSLPPGMTLNASTGIITGTP
jgi:Putative Ig domain